METTARFLLLRQALGLSARALSLKLELSDNVWHYYEAGKKEPSLSTLAKLAGLGINLNWLATGEGSILQSGLESGSPAQVPSTPRRLREVVSALKAVIEDSEARNLSAWASILERLGRSQSGLSIEALGEALNLSDLDLLQRNLAFLSEEGLVVELKGLYRLVVVSLVHRTLEYELQALLGIRELLNVVLPTARAEPRQALLLMVDTEAAMGAGRELLRDLKRLIESWHLRHSVPPPSGPIERVHLVLGGAFNPRV